MLVPDPSLQHVLGRLDLVVARAEQEVARRRAGDPAPDDRWRGLYFSDAELERLAGASPAVGLGDPGTRSPPAGTPWRPRRTGRSPRA